MLHLRRLGLLHTDCLTVNGKPLGENLDGAFVVNDEVIARREAPVGPEGGVAVLRGNLAPDGAVIKHTAAESRLLQHSGPAVVVGGIGLAFASGLLAFTAIFFDEFRAYQSCMSGANTEVARQECNDEFRIDVENRLG